MSLLECQPQPTQTGQLGKNSRSDVWIPQLFPQILSYLVEYTESPRAPLQLRSKLLRPYLGKPVVPA